MYKYEVIVWWSEEDEAYIAEVPELPGCMADGISYKEALKNVQVTIVEWIETAEKLKREIPRPKTKLKKVQEVSTCPEMVIKHPYIMQNKKHLL